MWATDRSYARVRDGRCTVIWRSPVRFDSIHRLVDGGTTATRMRETRAPARCGGTVLMRLRRAAAIAFCAHLVAGFTMAFVLRRGLETTPDLQERLAFLINHRALWISGWFAWTIASVAILYFYLVFAAVHQRSSFAVYLTVAALGPDLAAQAIEIGVLPYMASHALSTN